MTILQDYLDYLRTFLLRHGPNNGHQPMRFDAFAEECAEEEEKNAEEYEQHIRSCMSMARYV